jgi:hypothetical protein
MSYSSKKHRVNEFMVYRMTDGNSQVEVHVEDNGGASISSNLKKECEHCKDPYCNDECEGACEERTLCEQEHIDGLNENLMTRNVFNSAVDGAEAFLMALAAAGVDISDSRIVEAFFTTIEGAANNV